MMESDVTKRRKNDVTSALRFGAVNKTGARSLFSK